jgi:hypothetical protein
MKEQDIIDSVFRRVNKHPRNRLHLLYKLPIPNLDSKLRAASYNSRKSWVTGRRMLQKLNRQHI